MIHNSSAVDKKAKISKNVKIGPFCYVGPNVELFENVELTHLIHKATSENLDISFSNKVIMK